MAKKTGAAPEPEETSGNGIIVNRTKFARAKEILDLVTGKKVPKKATELERKEHYGAILAEHGIDPKGKKAAELVYEKVLGGLVRTPAEEATHQKKVAQMKKSAKKRAIES